MLRKDALLGVLWLWACSDGDEPSPADPRSHEGEEREDAAVRSDTGVLDAAWEAGAMDASPASHDAAAATPEDAGRACRVGPVPEGVRRALTLDAFYTKYADADGLAVLGSSEPSDEALASACELVVGMLGKRDDVRRALIDAKARFAILGKDEGTAAIPEYGYRERTQAERDQINQRARGLGGQVASCGEENILCLQGDRYWDESICVHEFAHTIATYGVYRADRTFERRLEQSYTQARDEGLLARTYRLESVQEYWAEGVQDWYDTNASASPPNGVHNAVDTRPELEAFDPTLHALVEEVFPSSLAWEDCHAR